MLLIVQVCIDVAGNLLNTYLPAFAADGLLLQTSVPQRQPRGVHSQLPWIFNLQGYCRAGPQNCNIHQQRPILRSRFISYIPLMHLGCKLLIGKAV